MVDQIPVKSKIDSGVFFKISRMKPVIKTTQPHGHKQYHEIVFLSAGAGAHWIDVQPYDVAANTLYFIMPGQVHCWALTQVPQGFVLMFRTDFLVENHLPEAELIQLGQRLNGISLTPEQAREINALLHSMEAEYNSDVADKERIIGSYLQILLLKLKPIAHGIPSAQERLESPLMQAFGQALEKFFKSKRQVQQYADFLAVSPKYLNDVCKKATGETASHRIEQRVVLEAKKLLIHTSKNISEIAFELNFQDPSHFAKFFTRCSGMTPTQYRERIR
ncbi:AraC family transcriptional regulator [Larkinella insperata]|uniref:AraC family transcriptional regulator n=1 Tax=Larkinella insperata TaxID=332158 RepID=A0ABW3Q7B4_9BACT